MRRLALLLLLALLLAAPAASADDLAVLTHDETAFVQLQGLTRAEAGGWTPQTGVGAEQWVDLGAMESFSLTLFSEGEDQRRLKAKIRAKEQGGAAVEQLWSLASSAGAMVDLDGRFGLKPGQGYASLPRPEAGERAATLKVAVELELTPPTPGGRLLVRPGQQAPGLDATLAVVRDWWLAGWGLPDFLAAWPQHVPQGLDCSTPRLWAVVGDGGCAGLEWPEAPDGVPVGQVDTGARRVPVFGLADGFAVPAEALAELGADAALVLRLFPVAADRFLVELDLGRLDAGVAGAASPTPAVDDDDVTGAGGGGGGVPGWALLLMALLAGAVGYMGAKMSWGKKRREVSADFVRASVPKGSGEPPGADPCQPPAPPQAAPLPGVDPPAPAPTDPAALAPADPALRGRIAGLERTCEELRDQLRQLSGRVDRADSARDDLAGQSGRWEADLGGHGRRLDGVTRRLSGLDEHVGSIGGEVQRLAAQAGGLETRVARFERQLDELERAQRELFAWRQRMEVAAAAGDEVGLPAVDDPVWLEVVQALKAQRSGRGDLERLAGDMTRLDPILRLLLWYADVLLGRSRITDSSLAPWFDADSRPEERLLATTRENLAGLRRGWVAAFARLHAHMTGRAPDRPLAREEKEALRQIVARLGDGPGLAAEVVKRVVVSFLTESSYLVDAALVERWGTLENRGQNVRDVALEALRHGASVAEWYDDSTSGDDFHLEVIRRLLSKRLGWRWVEIRPYLEDEDGARAIAGEAGVAVRVHRRTVESVADRAGSRVARLVGPRHVFRIIRPALVGPDESLPLECHVLGD